MSFLLRNILEWKWFGPKPKRIDLKFVPYHEAEQMLFDGWKIAKEEDRNRIIGMVWLEKLEPKEKQ